MDGVWHIDVLVEGGTKWSTNGTEEVIHAAYNELKDAKQNPATAASLVEISGFCDTADRAELTIFVSVESVVGVSVTRLY